MPRSTRPAPTPSPASCPPSPTDSAPWAPGPPPPPASPTSWRRWRVSGEPTRDVGADLDLTAPRSVHIVGVGGAGMSAIATVLARMGHRVSGSDLRESRPLERLGLLDVATHVG